MTLEDLFRAVMATRPLDADTEWRRRAARCLIGWRNGDRGEEIYSDGTCRQCGKPVHCRYHPRLGFAIAWDFMNWRGLKTHYGCPMYSDLDILGDDGNPTGEKFRADLNKAVAG